MPESDNLYLQRASTMAREAVALTRTRRGRWIGASILAFLLIFTVAGFFLVPHILRGILTGRVAASLHRPVSVGKIRFDPYTLRLRIDHLRVNDQAEANPLAAFEHIDVRASWLSLFRIAPILAEVNLVRPRVNVVRQTDGAFNFSDLLAPKISPSASAPAPAATSGPPKFAVSNIRIIDGNVTFDDKKLGEHHVIDKIELKVPFVASMPSKSNVVVEPLLAMRVDGQPIRIAGVSKPFAGSLDSALTLNVHRFDLARYSGYLPPSIAIKLPSGALSIDALVHFRQSDTGPSISINGALAIDQLDLRDAANAPVLAIDHGEVKMIDVEPLDHVFSLSEIALIGLKVNAVRNQDGTLNFSTLTPPSPPATRATPAPVAAPSAAPTAAGTRASQFDFGVEAIKVIDSAVSMTDLTGAVRAAATLENINAQMGNLRLHGQIPAEFHMSGNLHSGGLIAIKGTLDLPKSEVGAGVAIDQVDLPGLQAFAQAVFTGTIASGKFTLHTTLNSRFAADEFNLHVEPAELAIDNLAVQEPQTHETPIAWTHFGVLLGSFDLASKQVDVKEIRGDGIKSFVRRDRRGDLSIAALLKKQPRAPGASGTPAMHVAAVGNETTSHPWQYQVESVSIEKADTQFEDRATPRWVRVQFAPLNVHLKGLSSDFSKTVAVEIDGIRDGRGIFRVEGTAAIDPFSAALHLDTKNLELSEVDDYLRKQFSKRLSAEITSAILTTKSDVNVTQVQKDYRVKYTGDATVGNFTAIDKVTGDNFMSWRSLNLEGIDAAVGESVPKVHIHGIALSDLDARLILNSSGKLNLNDIVVSRNQAPKSLTKTAPENEPSPEAREPTPAPTAVRPMDADVLVENVTLDGGHVYYTDNFIQPHFSADLTNIAGSIGSFGTSTQQPAEVSLQGKVNGSAPLSIDGEINPLTPMAYVDIKAKAEGIELTGLAAYSAKYTGYPIVRGTLTADVHYKLDHGDLNANNHLFIDQLTFGERVESAKAINLPVRFAVAVLKNSRGEIDLNIPVSGSLSDPEFSITGVIWQAFFNVFTRAITSPFTLLTSAVQGIASGGGGASEQDLSFVAFDPGLATLTPDAIKQLTTLGVALQDHPALTLSIRGRVDPDRDLEGMREAWVADQIRLQKVKDVDGDADPRTVQVSQAEYDKYLTKAYYRAKFPKPSNFVGMAKSIPPDEMKKLMIANAPVGKDDLSRLAEDRAKAVRQYLSATLAANRLSILPPKLDAEGTKSGSTTGVDMSLQ